MLRFPLLAALFLCQLTWANAADVLTDLYNNSRTGLNDQETTLTPANVNNRQFGLLASFRVDGQVYAQILYKANVTVQGSRHNVFFVATQHDSVYAFDADGQKGSQPLWHVSFLTPVAGRVITTVPAEDTGNGDISPEIGITGSPVMDPSTNTLYVVSKTKEAVERQSFYVQKLHALDLATGTEKFGGPDTIARCEHVDGAFKENIGPTVPGKGDGSRNGVLTFDALRENQRPALALNNGVLYVAWSSHGDQGPFHGWLIGFDPMTLKPLPDKVFVTTPDAAEGGIWMSGCGPAFDSENNLYVTVGNGVDSNNGQYHSWGESLLKLSTSGRFTVADSYVPSNFAYLDEYDSDLGSGGVCLLPNLADKTGTLRQLLAFGGKEGRLLIAERQHLSGFHPEGDQIYQKLERAGVDISGFFSTPAYFNKSLFYCRNSDVVKRLDFDPNTGKFQEEPSRVSTHVFSGRHGGVTLSANGTSDAIVWTLENAKPVQLWAWTELLGEPIYHGSIPGCAAVKFTHPIVADGKVFVPAEDRVAIFGLLPKATEDPKAPSGLTAKPVSAFQMTLNWTNNSTNQSAILVERASAGGAFAEIGDVGACESDFTDKNAAPNKAFTYRIRSVNSHGASPYSNGATAQSPGFLAEPGLIADWPLSEGKGESVSDLTGNANHRGTIRGETAWVGGTMGASALNFHGVGNAMNHVSIPDEPAFRFSNSESFTVVLWAKVNGPLNHWAGVFAKSRDVAPWYGIWIDPANRWTFRGPDPAKDLTGPPPTGQWQQIAAVQDGKIYARRLYVNGMLAATGPSQFANGTGELWMGQGNADQEGFPGSLNEVRIYNRALSLTEITSLPHPAALTSLRVVLGARNDDAVTSNSLSLDHPQFNLIGNDDRATLILSFDIPIHSVASAKLIPGEAQIEGVPLILGKQVYISLRGLIPKQSLTLKLTGIADENGNTRDQVQVSVLIGLK